MSDTNGEIPITGYFSLGSRSAPRLSRTRKKLKCVLFPSKCLFLGNPFSISFFGFLQQFYFHNLQLKMTEDSSSTTFRSDDYYPPQATISLAEASLLSPISPPEFYCSVKEEEEEMKDEMEKKPTKKRKSWGQELPIPKTNLPPRYVCSPTIHNPSWLILSIENEQRRMTRRSNGASNVSCGTGRQRNHPGNENDRRLRSWKAKSVPSSNRTGYSRNVC